MKGEGLVPQLRICRIPKSSTLGLFRGRKNHFGRVFALLQMISVLPLLSPFVEDRGRSGQVEILCGVDWLSGTAQDYEIATMI